ncbi:MAG: flavodoxin domain-containing protein [Treponemataceae bacterium]|nr:flavodoxin domain-containing protein [Treponemataceae bacterium]
MKNIILYGSCYGTARRYAEKCAELTGIPAVSYKAASSRESYGVVVHFGALYAGGVRGLRAAVRAARGTARLIIVTVGLADVADKKNTDAIRRSVARQVPQELLRNAALFHLRGSIDYGALHFWHRLMMTLLHKKASRLPESQKTAEIRALLDTFGKKVDFVDYDSLAPVVSAVAE